MKALLAPAAFLALAFGLSGAAMADVTTAPGQNKTTSGPGVARECVLTFNSAENIVGGADVNVTKAQLMPINANSTKAGSRRTDIYQYDTDAFPNGTCLTNAWGPQ